MTPREDVNKQIPWSVKCFRAESQYILVDVRDRLDRAQIIKLPKDRLKLIQYVGLGANGQRRTLYAELRQSPPGAPFGPPHRIIYLGESDRARFDDLKAQLTKENIDWVWYPTPRKEPLVKLLPKASDFLFL